MWVSQTKWDALEERVRNLENKKSFFSDDTHLMVDKYPGGAYVSYPDGYFKVPIKDVLYRILDHLGMKLVYVKGKPEWCDIQPERKHK